MKRIAGFLFLAFVIACMGFAFQHRPGPVMPPTKFQIENTLIMDVAQAGSRLIAVGERGFMFASSDQGKTWQQVDLGFAAATLTAVTFVDDKLGFAVGHDVTILRTEDGGNTWKEVHKDVEDGTPLAQIWFADANAGAAIGAYGNYLESSDGGKTWAKRRIIEGETQELQDAADRHYNAIVRLPDGVRFIAGEAGTLLRSKDEGLTWELVPTPYDGSYFGALALKDGGLLIYGMRGKAFKSLDHGTTLEPVETGIATSLFGGRVLADGTVALVGQDGLLLRSSDNAKTFKISKEAGGTLLSAVFGKSADDLLVTGERGVLPASK